MELSVFLVFIGGFAVCAGLVFVISVFGVQGETFEEAIEKQKKEKNEKKEKKKNTVEKKKKVKKVKEPKNNNVQDTEDDILLVDPSGDVVEPVFVEPLAPTPPPPKKEESKAKKEEKKKETKKEKKAKEEKKEQVKEELIPVVEEAVVEEAVVEQKAAPVQAAPVEKAAVQQTAAPVESKPEKKKIEIVEVDEMPEDQDEKKKKKPSKEKSKKAAKNSNYEAVLEVVRKAALSDTEAQGIVDILLNKQTGKVEADDDWIEQGKESENKKMARRVAELQVSLEEENCKSGNLEKKMVALRKELNESKSQLAGHRRDQEEVGNKKTQEIAQINTRLQGVMSQLNNSVTLNRQLETNQTHYQTTITQLQAQLAQASSGTDPAIVAELDQLKATRTELTASNTSLQHNLNQKADELESMKAALAAAEQQQEAAQAAAKQQQELLLAKSAEEKASQEACLKEMQTKLDEQRSGSQQQQDSQLETAVSAKQQLDSQLSAVTAAKQQIQMELNQLKEKLTAKEVENSRILEENERLSEQVASSVERPAAEGEESSKMNGHSEDQATPEVKSQHNIWEEKYSHVNVQLKEISVRYSELEKDLECTRTEVTKLRTKNDVESGKLIEYKEECAAVFSRLFPKLPSKLSDLSALETQALALLKELESSAAAVGQVEELSAMVTRLEAQNSNYKTVLAQTENMLTNLQSSVESAEENWKKKLESIEKECADHKSNEKTLRTSVSELVDQVDRLKQTSKESENLTVELQTEKSSKDILAKKCAELQQLVATGQQHINNHTNDVFVANGSQEV